MVMVAALAIAGGACGGDATDDAAATTDGSGDTDSGDTIAGDADEASGSASGDDANGDDDSGDGDSGDDDSADDTGEGSGDDSSTGEVTLRDETIARLIGVGLTEVQAICIADNVPDLEEFVRTGESDPTEFLALVEPCAIDLATLTPPGG
jgi:hypothetical protein